MDFYSPELSSLVKQDDFSNDTTAPGIAKWLLPEWNAGSVEISSGLMQPSTTTVSCYAGRFLEAYENDQFSEVTVSNHGSDAHIGVMVRMSASGGYLGRSNNFASRWDIIRLSDTGAGTGLANDNTGYSALSSGDLLRLTVTGTSLSLTVNGTEVLSTTDTVLTGGVPGIYLLDQTDKTDAQITSWKGSPLTGTLTSSETVENNYEMCDETNFRVRPGELRKGFYQGMVRKESWDPIHPQEHIRYKRREESYGSERPEQQDRFIEDVYGTVTTQDLDG